MRNRVRFSVRNLERGKKLKILELRNQQIGLGEKIEEVVLNIIKDNKKEISDDKSLFRRDLFFGLDEDVALEIVKKVLSEKNIYCTRPQLVNFLGAIQNYQPGKFLRSCY